MKSPPTQLNARAIALVFGIIPCVLGVGLGQYLRWSGSVWLTDASGFWPIFCFIASLLACVYLALTTVNDRTVRVSAWLMLTWTWLYFPFWLTAAELPRFSAIISNDGRVVIASEWVRPSAARVWLFAGRGGNKIIHNVEGSATINAVDVTYKFAESYISSRDGGEDLSRQFIEATTAVLAIEARNPRSSRIALFEAKDAQERIRATVCSAIVGSKIPCPLKLTISPNTAATVPGGLWSKHFTEQEAIDERHLPTLVGLLTQDNSRIVRRDLVYALFMEFVETAADLAKVARKPHLLDDDQFNALIERIIIAPEAGNEALSLHASVSRLTQE